MCMKSYIMLPLSVLSCHIWELMLTASAHWLSQLAVLKELQSVITAYLIFYPQKNK